MIELSASSWAIAALALAGAVGYAAWHEYAAKNHRDAKLLAAIGALFLMCSAIAPMH